MVRWLAWGSLAAATVNFVRFYVVSLTPYVPLRGYAEGTVHMPFQGRMLMMYPLRWAGHSAVLQRMAVGRTGALREPELVAVNAVGLIAMFATGLLITWLYRQVSVRRSLPYLPWALTLLVCSVNYTAHLEQNFLYPYDLASVAFFTAGVALIYARRYWALALLFPVATLNRETTLFLIFVLALDEMATEDGLRVRRLLRRAVLGRLGLLSAMWVGVEWYVRHRFRANPTEMGVRIGMNLDWLAHPKFWPAILSACAYLLPFVLLLRARIADARIRAYALVIWAWIGFMFVYGQVIEQRVYGELSALVALAATLILESTVGGQGAGLSGEEAEGRRARA